MKTVDFKLNSGASLKVTVASWEKAVVLKETVDRVMLQADSSLEITDPRLNFLILSNAEVRRAAIACGDTALYEGVRVTEALFDDPSVGMNARRDWHEIEAFIIKTNRDDFFLGVSPSIIPEPQP